jgi:hypothetical protein
MKYQAFRVGVMFSFLAAIAVFSSGCGQSTNDGGPEPVVETSHEGEASTGHDGWWCVEHGVPEEECSMCSAKAADDFKAKGDWCDEHSRAESQCFKCDPSREQKFAALYEAKFGHAPPAPTE